MYLSGVDITTAKEHDSIIGKSVVEELMKYCHRKVMILYIEVKRCKK